MNQVGATGPWWPKGKPVVVRRIVASGGFACGAEDQHGWVMDSPARLQRGRMTP